MANLVMLEWFIENMCRIAVIWEDVIINSQKPLKSMVFCNSSGFTELLEIYVTHLTFMPELSIKASMLIWMVLQY